MNDQRSQPKDSEGHRAGPLAWMAANTVAANLLMGIAFVAGAVALSQVKQEVFPEFDLDMVQVSMAYPGASPAEVEQGVVLAVEESLRGLEGVQRVKATALEGRALVRAELLLDADPDEVLSDAKSAVDRIQSFPERAERPTVEILSGRRQVITLVIAGPEPRPVLERVAERARERLLARGDVTQVELRDLPPREIAIEVPRQRLEALGLDLPTLAARVGRAAVEVPAGKLETPSGELAVRLDERRERAHAFARLPMLGSAQGGTLRLGDIAEVREGYALTDQETEFEGMPAVRLVAYRVGDETPDQVAGAVRELAQSLRAELPSSLHVLTWNDDSRILRERIDLLIDNALIGFALVVLVLGAALKARLAGWVALGIPISFLGALALFPFLGLSVNMITLFALIITLGLVVDDAIIVGESVFQRLERGEKPLDAAVAGARDVVRPVCFSIATTLTAFSPMFFVPGVTGKIFSLIPSVVFAVLVLSLVECFFVLPAHLAHTKSASNPGPQQEQQQRGGLLGRLGRSRPVRAMSRTQDRLSRSIARFADTRFRSLVRGALRQRYAVIAGSLSLLAVSVAVVVNGLLPFSFLPRVEANRVVATARLPHGSPFDTTRKVGDALRAGAEQALQELDATQSSRGILTQLGSGPTPRDAEAVAETGSHLVTVILELVTAEQRSVRAADIARTWKESLPALPMVRSLELVHDAGPSAGAAVDVLLRHPEREVLGELAAQVTEHLRGDARVFNVVNGHAQGRPQLDFEMLPRARRAGVSAADLSGQLRAALYGVEALRQQQGRDETKVMVRLPEAQRDSRADLRQLRVRAPDGALLPLFELADFRWTEAPTQIERESGQRVAHVTAERRPGVASITPALETLRSELFPKLREAHDGLEVRLAGEQREQREAFESLGSGYAVALFGMYVLLAVPFRSYVRPLIIMAVIPFGAVGAIAGHLAMGFNLSIISMFGLIALSGVVVNDSLVLLDKVPLSGGDERRRSLEDAAVSRMRPIALTSLTTFLGLAPMIFETSMQARFLIPMAISLGFGVLGATPLVLLLLPSLDLAVCDLQQLGRRLLSRGQPVSQAAE